jgi:HAE1 family hydrophobic/amphiphilic exporter-1
MKQIEKSLIAKFSTAFVKRSRVAFLLFVGVLFLGAASYTTFLPREGFPQVQVPIVLVQTPYFVGDAERVDTDITSPIEKSIADIREIVETQSITAADFSSIIVEFEQDLSIKEASTILRDEVAKDTNLPKDVITEYLTFNAGAVDGKHDLIFTISNDRPIKESQEKAKFIADKLEKIDEIAEANVLELISKETNPLTGEQFDYQSSFNRIGIKKGETVEFSSAVAIGVIKKAATGTIELSDVVREEVEKIKQDGNLEGYDVSYGGDFAKFVQESINDLENNAVNGLIAVIVILYMLISWRASIVAAIFIPTVMAATLLSLFVLGYTLNVIVLFSLILVLGLIVDDAVVVVEAIDYQKNKGAKGIKAISSAIRDIGPADIAGTVTTVLVFLPMIFVSGLLGEFIQLIPITVITALILSILIGLTITPFLSNIFIADKKRKLKRAGLAKALDTFFGIIFNLPNRLVSKLGFFVCSFINYYLKHPFIAALVLVASIIWLALGVTYATRLTFSVFPPAKDSESINLFLSFPNGANITNAENISKDVEKILLSVTEEQINQVNYFQATKEEAFINVELTPIDSRDITSKEIVEKLENKFEDFGDTRIRVEQSGVGPPTNEFQINVQTFSDDKIAVKGALNDLEAFLTNRKINSKEKVTEVVIESFDNITKKDGRRFAAIKAKISDPSNSGLILNLQEDIEEEYDKNKLAKLGLEEDALEFDLGQEGENIESFTSTIFALAAALILMYTILVFQFNSLSQPLLIFLAIPFTFPGLFPGLFLTNNQLGFFVMLGIIALSGIVVNNTIFLVDFANQARRSGKGTVDSISQAIQIRFRPIIATSATTIVALLPLSLTNPFWESLALAIMFGLVSSSIMVIFAFPVYYAIVEGLRSLRTKLFKRIGKTRLVLKFTFD